MSNKKRKFLFPTEEEIIIVKKPEIEDNPTPISDKGHVEKEESIKRVGEEKVKQPETGIFKPLVFEDAKEIANSMIHDISVIVNIADLLHMEEGGQIASRIIDYLCGVAYAISFDVRRINTTTFLFTSNPVKEIKI